MVTRITINKASPAAVQQRSLSSFTQKLISVSIQLADNPGTNQPNFFNLPDGSQASSATFSNPTTGQQLRTSVRIQNSGSPSYSAAQVRIWGLPLSVVNQLSTLGMQLNLIPKNNIAVMAGDSISGLSTVFTGTIQQAYADFNAMPDTPMCFECRFGLGPGTALAKPGSFPGSQSVASIMQTYAKALSLNFENNGVNGNLSKSYFKGSLIDQVAACRDAAGIGAEFVDGGTTLAIFPKFGSRATQPIPVISAPLSDGTGTMITYPSYTQQGILVHTLFDPAIKFFGQAQVQSSLYKASGLWVVHKLDLALDAMLPNGEWKADVYCYAPGNKTSTPIMPPP
jgi:hypothetical protein